MSVYSLKAMAAGGINDQVGGRLRPLQRRRARGPSRTSRRCSTTTRCSARGYLHGFQATGDALLRRTCEETLDWALREMRADDGGFHAALDADSEGLEGAFYVWTVDQLRSALGDDAQEAIAWFGATERGNFVDPHHPQITGRNVLESRGPEPTPEVRERIRTRLREVREQREHPGVDDKRLTAWNALMVSALADAGAVLGREDYLAAAVDTADFLLRELVDGDGRLLRTYSRGRATYRAYLEDHGFLLEALLTLFEASGELRFFAAAQNLADTLLQRFLDPHRGGFFSVADDHETLVTRRKDLEDAPIPAGGSAAAFGLLRLAALTGEERYEDAAAGQLALLHTIAAEHPGAFGHLLQALHFHTGPVREVAIVGPPDGVAELLAVVREQRRTDLVLAVGDGDLDGAAARAVPLLRDRPAIDGAATAVRLRAIHLPGSPSRIRTSCAPCSPEVAEAFPSGALWRREWRSCARTPIARGSCVPGRGATARHAIARSTAACSWSTSAGSPSCPSDLPPAARSGPRSSPRSSAPSSAACSTTCAPGTATCSPSAATRC